MAFISPYIISLLVSDFRLHIGKRALAFPSNSKIYTYYIAIIWGISLPWQFTSLPFLTVPAALALHPYFHNGADYILLV
jgi:hypothetical protein